MSSPGIKARRRPMTRRALSACFLSIAVGGSVAIGATPNEVAWSQQYKGTTLRVIGEATLNTQIITDLAGDFETKTGIKVVVEQAPYDSLVQKATLDFASNKGSYDVLSIPYEYLGAFAEKKYIAPDILNKGVDAPGYNVPEIA